MSEIISTMLKRKLDELAAFGEVDAETRRNSLKEELQFYALNFIYHHPEYSRWIMYGGSALRIIHGLDRMSVDLDFEVSHPVTNEFLGKLKKEIKDHFVAAYNADDDFLTVKITNGRGLLLRFHVGEELTPGQPSNQVHVKLDLNHFVAPKTVTERRPINRGQFSFVILTYNMSALMASKLAAIFLRGSRGVSEAIYEEKGRDIYDLLWYMSKRITPDFDYLSAKNIDIKNPRVLFDRLTMQMNKVSDRNLKRDLAPLFVDQDYITNWLANWRKSYLKLLENYEIHTIMRLNRITTHQDYLSDKFSFIYWYDTAESKDVKIKYNLSDHWILFDDVDLQITVDKKIKDKFKFTDYGWSSKSAVRGKLERYAMLFYDKNKKYFEKTNRTIPGDTIETKFIRMTADKFNPNEQIILNKSVLLSCELDDLLK